jgi:hypothetical protein
LAVVKANVAGVGRWLNAFPRLQDANHAMNRNAQLSSNDTRGHKLGRGNRGHEGFSVSENKQLSTNGEVVRAKRENAVNYGLEMPESGQAW